MTEREKLLERLFPGDRPEDHVKNFQIFRGSNPGPIDPEALCKAINDAFDEVASGRVQPVDHFPEDECDCQCPEPTTGPALVSMSCPIHNVKPEPGAS